MKKLSIALCLILFCIVMFNTCVYATIFYDYDIDEFEQDNNIEVPPFKDQFDGGSGTEPPTGPGGTPNEYLATPFSDGRESGDLLKLHSNDGVPLTDIVFGDGIATVAALFNPAHWFSTGNGGHLIGKFEVNNNFWPDSTFGIRILNFDLLGGPPASSDQAYVGISRDPTNTKTFAIWGDESNQNQQDITTDLGSNTLITVKLDMNTSDLVTAMWDYGSDGGGVTFDLTKSITSPIAFNPGNIYTGQFAAGVPIPEPTTIALLGIGLAGLGGRYFRRRLKKQAHKV